MQNDPSMELNCLKSDKGNDDIPRALKSRTLSVRLMQTNSILRSRLTLKLLFLTHLRFLAALVKFLHNKLSFMIFNLAGSKTQVTFHGSEVQVTVLSIGN